MGLVYKGFFARLDKHFMYDAHYYPGGRRRNAKPSAEKNTGNPGEYAVYFLIL